MVVAVKNGGQSGRTVVVASYAVVVEVPGKVGQADERVRESVIGEVVITICPSDCPKTSSWSSSPPDLAAT